MNGAGILVDLAMRSSLLIALLCLAAAVIRGAGGSASMRHLIWLLGLASLALIPVLAAVMPPVELPILPWTLPTAAPSAEAAPAPSLVAHSVAAASAEAGGVAPAASIGLGDFISFLYLAVAAGLLGRLALGHWLLGWMWKRARPCDDARLTDMLATLCLALGIERRVGLRVAAGPAMPMTWGSLRPHILLPGEARGWSDERLRMVLLHELAHVARHDSLGRAAMAIVSAFYWFNPAVWYAVRQMRREQEHACDDLVLACGTKASAYARNLLDAAHAYRMPATLAGLSVAMATTSELERRLTAIVRRGSRRRASMRFGVGCAAAALAAASLVASATPVARGGDPASPAVERALEPRGSLAPMATAPNAGQPPLAPAPRPPTAPAGSQAPVAHVSAEASQPVPASEDEGRYDRELAQYQRDLRAYAADLHRYDRESAHYNRDLAALGAHPANLPNRPNLPNLPNLPNMPIPPTTPTVPTVPASPATPATPAAVTPPKQGP